MKKFHLIVVLGSILIAAAAQAAITVTNLNDSGPGSLRQAIADAAPGDTIDFDFAVTGTIGLTNGELVIDKDLTIAGPGLANLTISGSDVSRVLLITNGIVNISDVTIANGRLPSAFGPLAYAAYGAGIFNSATLTISNCSIAANTNLHNQANAQGGGLINGFPAGTVKIVNSSIARNYAKHHAGMVNYGTAALINSTVSENFAIFHGGGLENASGAFLMVTNSTISGNRGSVGGGISQEGTSSGPPTLWLLNSTVCSNSAGAAGGIFVADGTVYIGNSIVAQNTSVNIYSDVGFNGGTTFVSQDYNLIQNTNGFLGTVTGVTTHNIYNQDPLLGPLADNGGPTWTHALLPGSPAIDAGHSGGLATDQRGLPRPVDNAAVVNASGGDGSDIGAYEACAETNLVTNTNDSGPGSLRQAILSANACPGQNTIEFAPSAYGTITLTTGELAITDDLTINGPGAANLIVSGNNASRVFLIDTANVVTLSGLTVAHGNTGFPGGGIFKDSTALTISNCLISVNSASIGGGICNSLGTLTIVNSSVYGSVASDLGGGIYSIGKLTLINSAVYSNYGGSAGGGIWQSGNQASLVNCTVSGNAVMGNGGGIQVTGGATLTCTNCTITANNGWNSGGGFFISPGSVALRNTILAGNVALARPDCDGAITSDDYNLIQNTNGMAITGVTTHNIYNQDPLLGPLADNGGPTWTHALLTGSPAIGAGDPSFAPPPYFDQRGPGFPRVVSGRIDIGAFEYVYVCPGDADCDGIPDSWMYQYFGHATGQTPDKSRATDDADGDGQSNLAEFQAGTSPTNGASAFRIVEIAQLDEDVLLTWTTVGGKKYAVQTVTGGYTTNFVELSPIIIAPGTGESQLSVIHLGGATNAPGRFYRIRLVP